MYIRKSFLDIHEYLYIYIPYKYIYILYIKLVVVEHFVWMILCNCFIHYWLNTVFQTLVAFAFDVGTCLVKFISFWQFTIDHPALVGSYLFIKVDWHTCH